MKKGILALVVVMLFAGNLMADPQRWETKLVKTNYLEEAEYSDSLDIPAWATMMSIYVPTIDSGTMDFYIYRVDVDGTGSPKYFTKPLSIHCGQSSVSASYIEAGYNSFEIKFTTTTDVIDEDGQGSQAYVMNSDSATIYYGYVNDTLVSTHTILDPGTAAFSIGCSFKHDTASADTDGLLAYISSGTAPGVGWKIEMESDGDIAFTLLNTTGSDVARTTAATYDDNAWHRMFCIKDDDTMTIYIDGSAVSGATRAISGIGSGTLTSTTTQFFLIGKSSTTNHENPNHADVSAWEGSFDGVTYFDVEVTASEVMNDYTMFNEAQYAVPIQDAKNSDLQISAGTGLFLFDLTDDLQSFRDYMRIKFGTKQTADRTIRYYFKN